MIDTLATRREKRIAKLEAYNESRTAEVLAATQRIAELEAELTAHALERTIRKATEATNAELIKERDEHAATNAMLREALEDIQFHIVTTRSVESLESSIKMLKGMAQVALDATSSDWLRKHDAEVLSRYLNGEVFGIKDDKIIWKKDALLEGEKP